MIQKCDLDVIVKTFGPYGEQIANDIVSLIKTNQMQAEKLAKCSCETCDAKAEEKPKKKEKGEK